MSYYRVAVTVYMQEKYEDVLNNYLYLCTETN